MVIFVRLVANAISVVAEDIQKVARANEDRNGNIIIYSRISSV